MLSGPKCFAGAWYRSICFSGVSKGYNLASQHVHFLVQELMKHFRASKVPPADVILC